MIMALPVLPPNMEVLEIRKEFLTTTEQVAKSGLNCRERTALIFLFQTRLFNELAIANPNTKQGFNYYNQALRNYEAYLKYNR